VVHVFYFRLHFRWRSGAVVPNGRNVDVFRFVLDGGLDWAPNGTVDLF
jgi:hypothetical protein